MVFRIAIIILIFTTSLKGGVSIGMSFSEINNIINQVENIVKEKPINPTNEPTQEVWDSTTGSWVEEKINPVINGGGLNVNPADEDIDHVQDVVTTPPVVIPEEPPTSDNNGDTGDGGSGGGSGNVDTDDDVPTLLSIRSKIHTLQQEMVKQVEEVRGAERSVITNWETNETTSKRVDYGDLYAVLEKLVPDNSEEKQKIDDKKQEIKEDEDELESSIEEFEDEITEESTKFLNSINFTTPSKSDLNTLFELDAGNHNLYLNPFEDTYTGGISLGVTWQKTADWISLCFGLVACIIYWKKVRILINKVLETMANVPLSSPVTSVEVFGNSIGTLGLIAIKIGFAFILFGTTLLGGLIALYESNFTLGESYNTVFSVLDGAMDILFSGEGFATHAVAFLFDLIPIVAIGSLAMMYSTQAFLTWLFISLTISTSKALT